MIWRILKNKNKKAKTLLVVLFLVFTGVLFTYKSNFALADQQSCTASQGTWTSGKCTCPTGKVVRTDGYCGDPETNGNYNSEYVTPIDPKTGSVVEGGIPAKGSQAEKEAYDNAYKLGSVCTDNTLICAFKELLYGVFTICGWLFAIASTLFAWVVDPVNISGDNGILNKQAVKDVWVMVRDLLNMSFILVLLFAAFGTIFQMDKWNLKKVWLNILINALLVNFSYPIARIVIDISNVAFYYLLNNLFSPNGDIAVNGNTIFAGFGNSSSIGDLLMPNGYSTYPVAYMIASIVVLFIMGMTLMIIAGLFVVRLVALAMLIMFSPIGFVGYAIPSMSKHADDWWHKLFNYSFFAPIMVFVMAISLRIMEALRNENFVDMMRKSSANSPADQTNWIANAAFYMIPIIILWGGIGIAKSSGIAGADAVVKGVKKWGNKIASSPLGLGKWAWGKTGVPGGVKMGWDSFKKKGPLGTKAVEMRSAKIGGMLGDKGALKNLHSQRVKDAAEKNNYDQMSPGELRAALDNEKDVYKRTAMLKALADHNLVDEKDLEEVGNKFGTDSSIFNQLQSKVASYNTSAAFAHIKDDTIRKARKLAYMDSNKYKAKDQKLGALNAEDMELAITSGNMSLSDIDEQRKKSTQHGKAIDESLKTILTNPIHSDVVGDDLENEKHRKLHLAYLAQTGSLHDSIDGLGNKDKRAAIFSNLDKDSMKRMKWDVLEDKGHEILRNIKTKNIKEAIGSLSSEEKKRFIKEVILTASSSDVANIELIKDVLKNDPEMKRWASGR